MHCCCQLLWFVSIFALIFFTYIEIILASQPQFFPIKFSNKQQVINACIIVSMIYFVIFLLISALWWKQKYSHKKNEREQVEYIEMEQDKKSHDGAQ